jgi:hypothetical protein
MAYTTIDDPELYFQTKLYTGTGSSHAITLDGEEDMSPNLVIIKRRNSAGGNMYTDSIRNVQKTIISNEDSAEQTFSNGLTAFGSDGFTVGSESGFNNSSDTFVAWCWKESATSGFDIVSYTGTGSATTISHGLGSIPQVYFLKNRSSSAGWTSYFEPLGNTKFLQLDSTGAAGTATEAFNDTSPTSSVFSIGSDTSTNNNTDNFVAYLWTSKQGFSKVGGSYTGNGNADGTYVHLGFRPAWVMVKNTGATENWIIFDNKRPGYNLTDALLKPNLSNAESTSGVKFDLLSNGFKARVSDAEGNSSGGSFIYMAFAEAPFVNSNGVPCNAR